MFWTPPAMITSFVPLMTACAAKCTACCDEPHWRSIVDARDLFGQARGQPARARDVTGLRADRVDASEEDVLDRERVDVVAVDDRVQDVRAEIGRMHFGESTAALARRACGSRRR